MLLDYNKLNEIEKLGLIHKLNENHNTTYKLTEEGLYVYENFETLSLY